MWRHIIVPCALLAMMALVGCGKSSSSANSTNGPDKVVASFLKAVCSGDEATMFELLTEDARKGLKENGLSPGIAPSESASFEVTEFEMVETGAHVGSHWIETFDDGTRQKTPVVWMVRQEPAGWRIAGMAMRVFDDMMPAVLNFEQPAEMIRTQEMIDQEIARREQGDGKQPAATGGAKTR